MFQNRFDAAEKLLPYVKNYTSNPDVIVLAIPRGGLELGYVLAKGLHVPLDVIFTKKIGFPGNPEYAIGAASASHIFIDDAFKHIPELQDYIAHEVQSIRQIIKERENTYRQGMSPLNLTKKTVILVDDGVATGNTLLATIALVREYNPKKIVVALPVSSVQAYNKIKEKADEVACVLVPEVFYSVGQFYKEFNQVDDAEAIRLLHEANQ